MKYFVLRVEPYWQKGLTRNKMSVEPTRVYSTQWKPLLRWALGVRTGRMALLQNSLSSCNKSSHVTHVGDELFPVVMSFDLIITSKSKTSGFQIFWCSMQTTEDFTKLSACSSAKFTPLNACSCWSRMQRKGGGRGGEGGQTDIMVLNFAAWLIRTTVFVC